MPCDRWGDGYAIGDMTQARSENPYFGEVRFDGWRDDVDRVALAIDYLDKPPPAGNLADEMRVANAAGFDGASDER